MAYLAAKDVGSIEDRFIELLTHAPGAKTDKQDFFQRQMKVTVAKTSYEVMWDRLVDHFNRAGAGEAVFDYILSTKDDHLRRSLIKASTGKRVELLRNERAVVSDLFWENGKPRRIGQLLLEYMHQTGWLHQPVGKSRVVMNTTSPYDMIPSGLRLRDAFQPRRSAPVRQFPYDVALSYASEQRNYVKRVYGRLLELDIETFYDEGDVATMWGEDLVEYLENVYRVWARFCVVFVSRDYVEKPWPRFEAQSALARAVEEKGAYVLPVRFDRTKLPGLRPSISYISAKRYPPERVAEFIRKKLRA